MRNTVPKSRRDPPQRGIIDIIVMHQNSIDNDIRTVFALADIQKKTKVHVQFE